MISAWAIENIFKNSLTFLFQPLIILTMAETVLPAAVSSSAFYRRILNSESE